MAEAAEDEDEALGMRLIWTWWVFVSTALLEDGEGKDVTTSQNRQWV